MTEEEWATEYARRRRVVQRSIGIEMTPEEITYTYEAALAGLRARATEIARLRLERDAAIAFAKEAGRSRNTLYYPSPNQEKK